MTEIVWITGSSGYTGKFLADYLGGFSSAIRVVGGARSAALNKGAKKQQFHYLDITDPESISSLAGAEPPSIVFHLAGLAPPTDDAAMWHVNVSGTVNLLRELAAAECRNVKVVCAGSAAEYLVSSDGFMYEESPAGGESAYGRSKWAQTALALLLGKQLGIHVNVVRPFNIIGPNLPGRLVAGRVCEQYCDSNTQAITMGNIASERDFIDIRDVVSAYWQVAETGVAGEIYNVCSGVPTSIEDLLALFFRIGKMEKKIVADARPVRNNDLDRVYGSNEKIKSIGWQPKISLAQSVADMLKAVS